MSLPEPRRAAPWWTIHARHQGRDLLSDGVIAISWRHPRRYSETAAWWSERGLEACAHRQVIGRPEVEAAAFALIEALQRPGLQCEAPQVDLGRWAQVCVLAGAFPTPRLGMRFGREAVRIGHGRRRCGRIVIAICAATK